MATHMNENDRKRIEFPLSLNWPASEIARDRGRPESTILRDIHDPMLLGAKFKRHADKTTMEKYDVRKSDPTMTQK